MFGFLVPASLYSTSDPSTVNLSELPLKPVFPLVKLPCYVAYDNSVRYTPVPLKA